MDLDSVRGESTVGVERIAVIGAGASAAAFIHHLSKELAGRWRQSLQVLVFDDRISFGPGYAYQVDAAEQLFNGPVRAGSMFHDDPDDLWRWLLEMAATCPDQIPSDLHIGPNAYLPRSLYGRYVHDRFAESVDRLRGLGCGVDLVKERVAEVWREGRARYTVRSNSGALHVVSSAVFCTGNTPHADHYGLAGKPGYVAMPYPLKDVLAGIPPDASVGILGTQLTGTDVAIGLCERGHRGSIVLFSRSRELPVIRAQVGEYRLRHITLDAVSALRRRYSGGASLRSVLRLLRRELLAGGDDWRRLFFGKAFEGGVLGYFKTSLAAIMRPSHWQSVLIAMDEVVEECWNALSLSEKKHFQTRFDRLWLSRRAPIPAPNAYKLYSYLATGRVRYQPGISAVAVDVAGRFTVTCNQMAATGCSPSTSTCDVDVVVNATGPARDIEPDGQPSPYTCLVAQGLVGRDPFGGIRCDFDSSGVIDANGRTSSELFAIGHVTNGTYYFVASILMHSKHAKRVATAVVDGLQAQGAGSKSVVPAI